jgi:hypothetical protein
MFLWIYSESPTSLPLNLIKIEQSMNYGTSKLKHRHDTQHNDTQHNNIQHNDTQHNGIEHFKNVNNCLNTNIYSFLDTSGGHNYKLYLNVVHFFNTSVN